MITGCLSFFDEEPELLVECITALAGAGVDQLVAVDGPYALYPHTSTSSSRKALDAIRWATRKHRINLLLSGGGHAWDGNEVEKRQHMLQLARGAQPKGKWNQIRLANDWLLIVDADHVWESDGDLHDLLKPADTRKHYSFFAMVSFAEVFQPDGTPIYSPARPLMRARWDLRMGTNHYTYEIDDGFSTFLDRPMSTMRAYDLTDRVRVVHRVHDRDPEKRSRQGAYYEQRDSRRLEQ